ncbi:MAG: hypothetical protein M1834_007664 [Cirrosporium novae-zelandiae]|nr:MAG: hypothetical protein M1834_007664 [Cirrosporium novae-zelandiae]
MTAETSHHQDGGTDKIPLPDTTTGQTQPESSSHTMASNDTRHREDGYIQETPLLDVPPPEYSDIYEEVDFSQAGFDTVARPTKDGRVNIKINQKSRKLSNLLVPALRSQLDLQQPEYVPPSLTGVPGEVPPPPMSVVIQIVGSRGDVQPFVALGQVLKRKYGHRVRLATHATFKQFVEENGLEFFNIGGDPAELMAFMVKNPALMPGFDALKNGDVSKRRKSMEEIVNGCWRSAIEPGDGMGVVGSDILGSRLTSDSGISVSSDPHTKPFIADVIIANPPSFAHIHIAEKMGIPLHMMFTMPWSPTEAFPHPLTNVVSSNADAGLTNFMSYALVELLTWNGLGDVINRFRQKTLGLEPVSLMWAPGMVARLKIPYTYCWSPALIPKPGDWGSHIDISGFFFLPLASNYTPAPDLQQFLDAGPPPVYIGFGSIVVDDPNGMTKLIFEAVKKTGQRALVSKGWGGIGADELGIPDGVFMLGNVPHDWLFKHVSCVVHHGGAGTTAAGIACGRPTVIVPFFGDQPFWGSMVARAGAGPSPIPFKTLTAENLASAILEALKPSSLEKAGELATKISEEKGIEVGAQCFNNHLEVDSMRCMLAPSHLAVWRVKRTQIRLSAFAAAVLGLEGLLSIDDLKLYRSHEYETEDGPWDPITGGASALVGTLTSLAMSVADFPKDIFKAMKTASKEDSIEGKKPQASEGGSERDSSLLSKNDSGIDIGSRISGSESERASETIQRSGPKCLTNSDDIEKIQKPRPESSASTSSDVSTQRFHESSSGDPKSGFSSPSGNSMRQALRGELSSPTAGSRTSSRSPHRRALSRERVAGAEKMSLEAALSASKGVSRIVGTGMKSPMDFMFAIARGFHNAPKLYGDTSVRPTEKISGFQSGLKAAGKEFGFGFYDGITGLVTQPMEGAKKEGVAGLIKGFGKGMGGVVFKPGAAIWALPGYTFKGIYQELNKFIGPNTQATQSYIVAARIAEGYNARDVSTEVERLDVIRNWERVRQDNPKKKNLDEIIAEHHSRHIETLRMPFDERKELWKERDRKKKQEKAEKKQRKEEERRERRESMHTKSLSRPRSWSFGRRQPEPDDQAFEEAIVKSVAATSRGNEEQDQMIERALRASVAHLQAETDEDDSAVLEKAIQASINETRRANPEKHDDAPDQDQELLAAIKRSLSDFHFEGSRLQQDFSSAVEDIEPNIDDDDDAELQRAIEASKLEHEKEKSRAKTEEDIVLEYVRKQSLAEESYRRLQQRGSSQRDLKTADNTDTGIYEHAGGLKAPLSPSIHRGNSPPPIPPRSPRRSRTPNPPAYESDDPEDEDLKRALAESLKDC